MGNAFHDHCFSYINFKWLICRFFKWYFEEGNAILAENITIVKTVSSVAFTARDNAFGHLARIPLLSSNTIFYPLKTHLIQQTRFLY